MAKSVATLLLRIKAVILNPNKPFRFTSGILSPIYCDNRQIISYPIERIMILNAFLDIIREKRLACDVIAGTATAGIPHAAWIADRLQLPMVYVRAEAKKHGKQNQIEGVIKPGETALIVEDLISTGSSALNAAHALRDAGAIVNDCLAIFTYELQKAEKQFADTKIKLHALSNFTTLIDVAVCEKYITAQEKEIVLAWQKNPDLWP